MSTEHTTESDQVITGLKARGQKQVQCLREICIEISEGAPLNEFSAATLRGITKKASQIGPVIDQIPELRDMYEEIASLINQITDHYMTQGKDLF